MASKKVIASVLKDLQECSEFLDTISAAVERSVEKKLGEILERLDLQDERLSRLETSLKKTDKLCADLQTQINDSTHNITTQCEQLNASIVDLTTSKNNMEQKINPLKETLDTKCNTIDKLESTLNDLEQYSRRNCLRIFGVPQRPDEKTDEAVLDVARRIGVQLGIPDIDRSHRVGKQPSGDRSRGIIVKLASYRTRQKLIQNRRKLKGTGITIHEDLTSKNRELLLKAQGHEKVTSAWTVDGRVFILIPANNGTSVKRVIRCKEDLIKL